MSVREIRLTVPLPPSPNQWPKHPMEHARKKNAYRRSVWIAAVQQHTPMADPPEHVVVSATLYVWNERDEDNATASMKWTLDALSQEQTGKVHWRQGLADRKGYWIDDDPAHLTLLKPTQEIDRENPRVELVIRWNEAAEAA